MTHFEHPLQDRLHLQLLVAIIDKAGVVVGSIGGTLHARRHPRFHYDIIGAFGLALVSALGGGIMRDLMLQHGPPLALVDTRYLDIALASAAATLLLGGSIGDRTESLMNTIDAAAVSFFAVAGTARAEAFGLTWLPAVMLGVLTAVGGGSLRDVLSGTTPRVFETGNFYAIAALAAALAYLGLDRAGLPDLWCITLAVIIGFSLRMLSIRFNWTTDTIRLRRP
jgi:uncharacterized membrane protein YeiH